MTVGKNMTAWDYLKQLNGVCHFWTRERNMMIASNSELKRWLINGAIELNGRKIKWDEEVDFPVTSLVLFPNSKRKTTIF